MVRLETNKCKTKNYISSCQAEKEHDRATREELKLGSAKKLCNSQFIVAKVEVVSSDGKKRS